MRAGCSRIASCAAFTVCMACGPASEPLANTEAAGLSAGKLEVPAAGRERLVAFDAVEDCNLYQTNPTRPLDLSQTQPADVGTIQGTIYPSGTLKPGNQSNLPSDPGGLGVFRSRFMWTVSGPDFLNGASPFQSATLYFSFGATGRDALVLEGLLPNIGYTRAHAVIGGTGIYRGVRGEVLHTTLGNNGTGCFNYHFEIRHSDG